MRFCYFLILMMSLEGVSVQPNNTTGWDADYHTKSDFQYQRGKLAIDSLELIGNEQVLDIGCGTGRTTHYCAQKLTTGQVHGVDFSPEMIAFAQNEYSGNERLTFSCQDAQALTFSEKFDVVYSLFCLQWVPNQQAVVQHIMRALKSGGRALLYVSCANELARHWFAACEHVATAYPKFKLHMSPYVFLNSPETWVGWAEAAGAKQVRHEYLERTKHFVSPQELKTFLLSLAIEPKMTGVMRDDFLDHVVHELYRRYDIEYGKPFDYTVATMILSFTK